MLVNGLMLPQIFTVFFNIDLDIYPQYTRGCCFIDCIQKLSLNCLQDLSAGGGSMWKADCQKTQLTDSLKEPSKTDFSLCIIFKFFRSMGASWSYMDFLLLHDFHQQKKRDFQCNKDDSWSYRNLITLKLSFLVF